MSGRYGVLLGNTARPSVASLPSQPPDVHSEGVIQAAVPQNSMAVEKASAVVPPSSNDSMTPRQPDGMTASRIDSLESDPQDSLPSTPQDGMTAYSLHAFLTEKATEKTTVRLPEQLVHSLEDTLYRIKREQKVKLSMKSILIVTLAMFCQEFEQQGTDSVLYV